VEVDDERKDLVRRRVDAQRALEAKGVRPGRREAEQPHQRDDDGDDELRDRASLRGGIG
jgi:hypothetical protein